MELFGHGCVRRVRATVQYPDGAEGVEAEASAEGVIELHSGLCIALSVVTDLSHGPDLYELELTGQSGTEPVLCCTCEFTCCSGTLLLENFTDLKRTAPAYRKGWVVQDGSYGRVECVKELVRHRARAH